MTGRATTSSSPALKMRSRASCFGCSGRGSSLKVPLRVEVSTSPMRIGSGRRERGADDEMATLEVAEHLGLPALHAQKIGGAGHVDVEEGAAHEKVRGFRRHVLGELGKALGRDDAGQSALAPAAHEVGHGAERDFLASSDTSPAAAGAKAAPRPPPRASDTSNRAPHRRGRRGRPPRSASAPPDRDPRGLRPPRPGAGAHGRRCAANRPRCGRHRPPHGRTCRRG